MGVIYPVAKKLHRVIVAGLLPHFLSPTHVVKDDRPAMQARVDVTVAGDEAAAQRDYALNSDALRNPPPDIAGAATTAALVVMSFFFSPAGSPTWMSAVSSGKDGGLHPYMSFKLEPSSIPESRSWPDMEAFVGALTVFALAQLVTLALPTNELVFCTKRPRSTPRRLAPSRMLPWLRGRPGT